MMRPFFQSTVNNLIEVDIFTIENSIHMNDPAGGISAGAPPADETRIVRAGKYCDCGNGQGCGYMLAGGIIPDVIVADGNKRGDLTCITFYGHKTV